MRIRSVVHCLLALATLSFAAARNADAGTNCGSPGPDQAIVWENDPPSGNCDILEIGSYPYSAVVAMSVGNDAISYVSVGSKVKVTLYEHDLPGTTLGDWLPVITSRSVVSDFNDKTSSIRVESRKGCLTPGAHQVVVWSDFNFSGNCDVLDLGYQVTYAKILGLSVGNDMISSIKCGSASAVLLWENDLNSGSSFQSANACVVNTLANFDDQASSLVVEDTNCTAHGSCFASGYFCELPNSGCTETMGTCTAKPTSCSSNIDPSCGCDGKTYANDCERQAAGVPEWANGQCSVASCPSNVPQPGTSCSPENMGCIYSVPVSGQTCAKRMTCTNGVWSASTVVCGFSHS